MPKTFSAILIHVVFSTKNRTASLAEAMRREVFAYLMGIARNREAVPIRVGGFVDHVHLLLQVPPKIAVSDLVGTLKCNSSSWIYRRWPGRAAFAWQDGFGAFSVSPGRVALVKRYIENQVAHHEGRSYEAELENLFEDAGLTFDNDCLR